MTIQQQFEINLKDLAEKKPKKYEISISGDLFSVTGIHIYLTIPLLEFELRQLILAEFGVDVFIERTNDVYENLSFQKFDNFEGIEPLRNISLTTKPLPDLSHHVTALMEVFNILYKEKSK